jgi:hypothetical protein
MMQVLTAKRGARELRLTIVGVTLAVIAVLGWCSAARADLVLEPGASGFSVTTSTDQAGAHPDVTQDFKFVTNEKAEAGANLRHLVLDLPPGLVGAPVAAPTCTPAQLTGKPSEAEESEIRERGEENPAGLATLCPVDSQVGTTTVTVSFFGKAEPEQEPVYNIVPAHGQTADFGFSVGGLFTINIVFSVRPGDYGVTATVNDISGFTEILADSLTVWGIPADHIHDAERGMVCFTLFGECKDEGGGHRAGQNPTPFLTNPSECTGQPLTARLRVSSWQGSPAVEEAMSQFGPIVGCERLQFDPSMSIAPTTSQADSPAGYTIGLDVPQDEAAEGVGSSALRDALVTLPAGTALSPSAATGLVGCAASGPEGIDLEGPESVEVDQYGDSHSARGHCPLASELGTVKIVTPLVSEAIEGDVFLAEPSCGGSGQPECVAEDAADGKLFGVYLEATGAGAIVKLHGHVSVDPQTGQISTSFDENPQIPFGEFQLNFFGGPRSPLANPQTCGQAVMTSQLTPYSSLTPAEPFGTFTVTGCEPAHFAPSFTAGTTSNQAGYYSPLSVTFSREDQEGELGQVTVSTPPGLLGMLSHVSLCGEPQAAQGTCSSSSQIGQVTASAGPGPDPYYVSGGKVYVTGPYNGAPYGLSIVEPAAAGPFNLGDVVVRGAIHVDPHTAALTIKTDPLPTVKDGILLQIKTVHVEIDRPEFVFNPTNCDAMSLEATLASTTGMSSTTTNHFQVTNCAALAFKPQFAISTSGHTSRADGASLDVKLSYPKAVFGTQANIAKVKIDLPKQLPSRLTTLQKACPDSVFDENPASCPSGSRVGEATVTTPVLSNSLSGPAYFVSHGGAKFPELIIVLSGGGVTVDVNAETFINKAGITSSTLRAIPDVPFENFELKLPQGSDSALAANGNLCTSTLRMPTAFIAQNGAAIHESTPITATGCAKHKAKKATVRKKRKGKKK